MNSTSDSIANESSPPPRRGRSRSSRWALGVTGIVLIPAVAWLAPRHNSISPGDQRAGLATADLGNKSRSLSTVRDLVGNPAAVRREQVVGQWVLNDSIRRDITIREDGTATMLVKLDFLGSLFYGSEMSLDLLWDLNGDVFTHTIVSGSPQANVDSLIRDFGATRSYRVLSLDKKLMLLKSDDEADPEEYRWVRAD